jgi:hypothetical protein
MKAIMTTVGLVIFFIAWAGAAVSGIAMVSFKAEARAAIENQGGKVPLSLRTNVPVEIKGLDAAAVLLAQKSNNAGILTCGFVVIGLWGAAISTATPAGILVAIVGTIFPVSIATYIYRINRQTAG